MRERWGEGEQREWQREKEREKERESERESQKEREEREIWDLLRCAIVPHVALYFATLPKWGVYSFYGTATA